jgi:hypothetical protein
MRLSTRLTELMVVLAAIVMLVGCGRTAIPPVRDDEQGALGGPGWTTELVIQPGATDTSEFWIELRAISPYAVPNVTISCNIPSGISITQNGTPWSGALVANQPVNHRIYVQASRALSSDLVSCTMRGTGADGQPAGAGSSLYLYSQGGQVVGSTLHADALVVTPVPVLIAPPGSPYPEPATPTAPALEKNRP